jgi:hypothetical protein
MTTLGNTHSKMNGATQILGSGKFVVRRGFPGAAE